MTLSHTPRGSIQVTVGMPVRDGAPMIERALRTVLDQTHANLAVVISDNVSSDSTPDICRRIARADARVTYFRQASAITAWENFEFVLRQARTEYFMWAAHDDLRSVDYVERLLAALAARPDAVLAYGACAQFCNPETAFEQSPQPYDRTTNGRPYYGRLRQAIATGGSEIYGLHRTSVIKAYDWEDSDFAPDVPLLTHVAVSGEIIQVPRARFVEWIPIVAKRPADRALSNSYRRLRRFRLIRLSLRCARVAVSGERTRGRRRWFVAAFAVLYLQIKLLEVKTSVYNAAPPFLRTRWKSVKYSRRGLPLPVDVRKR